MLIVSSRRYANCAVVDKSSIKWKSKIPTYSLESLSFPRSRKLKKTPKMKRSIIVDHLLTQNQNKSEISAKKEAKKMKLKFFELHQNGKFSSGKGILITSTERNRHKLLLHYILGCSNISVGGKSKTFVTVISHIWSPRKLPNIVAVVLSLTKIVTGVVSRQMCGHNSVGLHCHPFQT